MSGEQPDGFWRHDPFDSDNQRFFRETADEPRFMQGGEDLTDEQVAEFKERWRATYAASLAEGRAIRTFVRTPLVSWWRYADCRWWCRLPWLCRLAGHVREEWTP